MIRNKGKLTPRYIRPFEIFERIGKLAHRLALPPKLSMVHNVIHMSIINKYVPNPTNIITQEPIQIN